MEQRHERKREAETEDTKTFFGDSFGERRGFGNRYSPLARTFENVVREQWELERSETMNHGVTDYLMVQRSYENPSVSIVGPSNVSLVPHSYRDRGMEGHNDSESILQAGAGEGPKQVRWQWVSNEELKIEIVDSHSQIDTCNGRRKRDREDENLGVPAKVPRLEVPRIVRKEGEIDIGGVYGRALVEWSDIIANNGGILPETVQGPSTAAPEQEPSPMDSTEYAMEPGT